MGARRFEIHFVFSTDSSNGVDGARDGCMDTERSYGVLEQSVTEFRQGNK